LAFHPVNCHPTISHDFPAADQIDVVPEQPRAAVRTDVAPARVEAAAYTYYVPSAVAEQA